MKNHKINLFGEKISKNPLLRDIFIMPPFSVMNAREGEWQNRKRLWIKLGIQSELGRGENLQGLSSANNEYRYNKKAYFARLNKISPGGSPRPACDYSKKERGDGRGRPLKKINGLIFKDVGSMAEVFEARGGGTSIFDPVLTELMYKWFCPKNGKIFDPFAGGSVRGIVANYLGYKYTGIDLSKVQIESNREQAKNILKNNLPEWIVGDGKDCLTIAKGKYDFIFSCPPYGNLEVYSDDEKDLSTLDYPDFLKAYFQIIIRSTKMLKQNRFACFVVANFRDKKTGFYNTLVSDTIRAFQKAGALYYNECILVTAIGSLPIRIKNQFKSGRKIGKTHQNVLIFYKGNPKEIKNNFKEIEKHKW